MRLSRRQFLKGSLAAGAFLTVGGSGSLFFPRAASAFANSPPLAKWAQPMRLFGADIPFVNGTSDPHFTDPQATLFNVTVGEFQDQLHPALGPTKLWGYWDTSNPVKLHLAGVALAYRGTPVRMRFTNMLPARHLLPVDSTLPGADKAHNRIAVHLHGGFVPWTSDGGPFDWWDPSGAVGLSFLNGPGGFLDQLYAAPYKMAIGQADYYYPNDQSTRLLWYHDHAHGITRLNAYAGIATGYLLIDSAQESALANVAGFPALSETIPLVVQDKVFVNPATIYTTDPSWRRKARSDVQSRGSLWYEHVYDPAVFRLLTGKRYLPVPNPSAIPEFFGDTMLCNGLVHPFFTVEPRPYRFMLLNACNSRVLNVNLFQADPNNPDGINLQNDPTLANYRFPTNPVGPPLIQIGTEGGYLIQEVYHPNGVPVTGTSGNMVLAPAERADFLVDFSGKADGTEFILYNDAPGPFPDGPPTNDYFLGNTNNPYAPTLPGVAPDTRQILKFRVQSKPGVDYSQSALTGAPILNPLNLMDPAPLVAYPPTITDPMPPLGIPTGAYIRSLTLNEDFDQYGRLRQLLGTATPGLVSRGFGLEYLAPATEVVQEGSTEVWRIFNLSADTHPIHFHLVNVQVLSRQPFRVQSGAFVPSGPARGPELNELGWKETVQMHPGEVIQVAMRFDLPNVPFSVPSSPRATAMKEGMGLPSDPTVKYHEYVWHCHILEHEEHDMMRPLVVKSPA